MRILRVKPDFEDLRNYIVEGATSDFGFSKEIRKLLEKTFPVKEGFERAWDYSDIEGHSIESMLESENIEGHSIESIFEAENLKPEYLYYIVDIENNRISRFNSFTSVEALNIDIELVIFGAYNLQIYYLLNSDGDIIEGPCHDLEISLDGKIMFRNSGGMPIFQMRNYLDKDFHKLGDISPFDNFQGLTYGRELNFINDLFISDSGINESNKNDRNYVLEAVRTNGWSLKFASIMLQDDEEIVLAACLENPLSFKFASERLKCDINFVIMLIIDPHYQVNIFPYLPPLLENDQDIIRLKKIMEYDFSDLSHINCDNVLHKYKRELVLRGLERNSHIFEELPELFRDDYQLAHIAINGFSENYNYCSEKLKSDERLKNLAIKIKIKEETLKDLPF